MQLLFLGKKKPLFHQRNRAGALHLCAVGHLVFHVVDIDIHRGDHAVDAAVPALLGVGGDEDALASAREDGEAVTIDGDERIHRLEDVVVGA